MLFAMMVGAGEAPTRRSQPKIDEGLFIRIGEGDKAAFEELYTKSQRAVYTFALSLTKNPQDAFDITQDTFLKVRQSAHLYKPQGKPLAWLFTIARNLTVSLVRREAHTVSTEDMLLNDSLAHSYLSDPTDRMALAAVLDTLEQIDRQIILLHIVSGLKHREIAKNVGLPLGTVLSRYHRSLLKLRKELEGGAKQ